MLEIFILAFIGRKFKELAENCGKTPWKIILLAIGTYIGTAIIAVVIVFMVSASVSTIALSLLSIPVGSLSCYALYSYFDKTWKKNPIKVDEINQIGKS